MAIFRANKDNGHFTMISHTAIRSGNLSMKATGLLSYILSNADDWVIHKEELSRHFTDGTTSLNSAFNELIKAGYIVVTKTNGEDGRFKWVYDVYEDPNLNPNREKTMDGNTIDRKPMDGNPMDGNPMDGNPMDGKQIPNNTNINNTNKNNNKNNNINISNFSSSKTLFDVNTYNVVNEVIGYLNSKAGTHFKPTTKAYISEIEGRLKDGYRVEDFKYVIDVKVAEWKDNSKMQQYLTPTTLFSASHFDNYLNQKMPVGKLKTIEGISREKLQKCKQAQQENEGQEFIF